MEDSSVTVIIGGIIALFLMGGLFFISQKKKAPIILSKNPKSAQRTRELKKYTKEEVAKHCTEKDAWIIVDGRVYDITDYDIHPGGDAILRNVGADSSVGFHGPQHPPSVWDVMREFLIGDIVEATDDKLQQ